METIDFLRWIHKGDTIDKTVSLADYPAGSGWALKIVLTNTANNYVLTSTADGDDHSLDLDGSALGTGAWVAGKYKWIAFVEKDGDRQRISSGEIQVFENIEDTAADLRSHAEKVLDAIEALIEGKATTDDLYTQINGKALSRYPYEQLISLRNTYRAEVREERRSRKRRQGKAAANQIRVRFP